MVQPTTLKFATTRKDFSLTLNKRVNDYFKNNQISRHGNTEMVVKTIFMLSLYFIPYALIIGGLVTNIWIMFGLVLIMSLGLSGIGLSIMHDANHGAYSKKPWINSLLGYTLNMVGANAFTWKMQHNVLHHTYTNVHEADEDISTRGVIRMNPHSEWKPIHKYQFIYAWFLYGLMTIVWMVFKDFVRLVKYQVTGLAKKHNANILYEWLILLSTKLYYITYIVIIPLVFTSLAWWQIVIGILTMHYIAGFVLAIIFQPAHVIDGTEFPLPDESNELENNWAIHQLLTTTNFANKSKWFTWYVGGLNFQVEHHLFPNVCHVHYHKISNIVKETAEEYGLPYKSARTFYDALAGHAKLLKDLGKRPDTLRVV